MDVAVVTDSTCDLPGPLAEALGIRVVPLTVHLGDREGVSGVTIDDETLHAALRGGAAPTTSRPAPYWFEEAYADVADEGGHRIVSIHVSGALSGTLDAARLGGAAATLPVRVVDSRQVSGGLALQVLAAHRAAVAGDDVEEVVAAAARVRESTTSLLTVESLEPLRRGGRLSAAQAAIGTVLKVRPILGVVDGRVELVDRARTTSRALRRMVETCARQVGEQPVHAVVAHGLAPELAARLWVDVREDLDVADELEVVIGPVVSTHTGTGAIGLSVAPARPT